MSDQAPVTDDDRKAHEWAHANKGRANDSVARAIFRHVPAPPATLAAELRAWGKHPAAFAVSTELLALADRVEAVEGECVELRVERDQANYLMKSACRERDEARAEVERLTSGRTVRESRTVALPDPADVPPGEPWLVEFNGERRIALRSDPDDCKAWYLPSRDLNREGAPWVRDIELALVARLVPDVRRVIDRPEGLDALAGEAIVLSVNTQYPLQHGDDGDGWYGIASVRKSTSAEVLARGPVVVLWEPEVTA